MTGIREPLARAKGTGATGGGTHHYITQKVSAVALILLGLWLMPELVSLGHMNFVQPAIMNWLHQPFNAILLTLFVLAAAIHFYGHLEEVILDYVNGKAARLLTLVIIKFAGIVLVASMLYAIIFMSFFGGTPNA